MTPARARTLGRLIQSGIQRFNIRAPRVPLKSYFTWLENSNKNEVNATYLTDGLTKTVEVVIYQTCEKYKYNQS